MLAAGRLSHQPPHHLNGHHHNRPSSLTSSETGVSGSVLPVAGIPNSFPRLLPPEIHHPQDGSEEDDAAYLFENDGLDDGNCFSVPSLVRKEAESSALVQEERSIGSSRLSRLQTGVQGFKMVLVLVRVMTIITGKPQQQGKPLMLFQTLSTPIFMGSTPA
jgi:hypothetical protein